MEILSQVQNDREKNLDECIRKFKRKSSQIKLKVMKKSKFKICYTALDTKGK